MREPTTPAPTPLTPAISSPANYSVSGVSNVTVTGSEPAHGGAGAILFQLNGGAAQSAQVSTNGLKWSAPVTLAPGTNIFWVRATNNSGASPVVKAQYVLNPFIPAAGSYCGLFTSGAAITNAGFFNLTLQNSRTFTGYILLAGAKAPFAGQFDTNGAAAAVASNAPGRVYRLALQLDLSGINPMSGSISNTTQGWTGSLSAVRAAYGAALPATHYEGNYVLAINNGDGNPALAPPGSSYALAGISATGVVTLNNATMADGTTLTPVTGTGISQDGDWPLYGSLNSGKGAVLAWVKFPARSAPSRMTSGQALWFESAGTGSRSYTNGFSLPTNQLNLIVNSYAAPSRGVAVLPDPNYTVAFFGGNLPANLTNTVTISATSPVDPNIANNTANDGGANILTPTADLSISISGPSPALVVTGQSFTETSTVSNGGPSLFYGLITMTTHFPAGITVASYVVNGWSCSPAAQAGPVDIVCTRTYTSGSPTLAGLWGALGQAAAAVGNTRLRPLDCWLLAPRSLERSQLGSSPVFRSYR